MKPFASHSDPAKEPVARAIGQTFAIAQHLLDLSLTWGFRVMKKVSDRSAEDTMPRKGIVATAKHATLRTMHFLGSMGDAYYEWYGRMKAEKTKRKW